MKPINKEVLKVAAHKMMFDMEENQYDTLLKDFETILKQMRYISEIPGIDDVEPMTFPFDVSINYLREDIPLQIYSREEILKNAHSKKDDQIELPKVVK